VKRIGYLFPGLLCVSMLCSADPGSRPAGQSSAAGAASTGKFQLQVSQGYRFETGEIRKSGDGTDLSFTYQLRRLGVISYLQATRIKRFDTRPDTAALTRAEIAAWPDYVAGPSPGYYVIQGRSDRRYLLKLESFENQGKAAAYWRMTFSWEEIGR
jgi:hypothetical protein